MQGLLEGQPTTYREGTYTLELQLADDLPALALDAGLIRSACATTVSAATSHCTDDQPTPMALNERITPTVTMA